MAFQIVLYKCIIVHILQLNHELDTFIALIFYDVEHAVLSSLIVSDDKLIELSNCDMLCDNIMACLLDGIALIDLIDPSDPAESLVSTVYVVIVDPVDPVDTVDILPTSVNEDEVVSLLCRLLWAWLNLEVTKCLNCLNVFFLHSLFPSLVDFLSSLYLSSTSFCVFMSSAVYLLSRWISTQTTINERSAVTTLVTKSFAFSTIVCKKFQKYLNKNSPSMGYRLHLKFKWNAKLPG